MQAMFPKVGMGQGGKMYWSGALKDVQVFGGEREREGKMGVQTEAKAYVKVRGTTEHRAFRKLKEFYEVGL